MIRAKVEHNRCEQPANDQPWHQQGKPPGSARLPSLQAGRQEVERRPGQLAVC